MNLNADLVARYMLRMASEIEALLVQRDTLAEENERLKQEIAALQPKETGLKAVPKPDEGA